MSGLERPVPPAGDDIHIPGGSLQPVLLTVFITLLLLGLTTHWLLVAVGVIGSVLVIARWIGDTRRDIAELPVHDAH